MDELAELERIAQRLASDASAPKGSRRVPALVFVTDPDRTPDPAAVAARLPHGAGVIHRGFGRPQAAREAHDLARIARARGLVFLVGADAVMAAETGAAGVHLPERALHLAPRLRARRPAWILTGAAHSPAALRRAARFGLDAVLVSPVFPSRSPSATASLGPELLRAWVRRAELPVLALGGVDAATAPRLLGTGVSGLAAVEAIARAALRT